MIIKTLQIISVSWLALYLSKFVAGRFDKTLPELLTSIEFLDIVAVVGSGAILLWVLNKIFKNVDIDSDLVGVVVIVLGVFTIMGIIFYAVESVEIGGKEEERVVWKTFTTYDNGGRVTTIDIYSQELGLYRAEDRNGYLDESEILAIESYMRENGIEIISEKVVDHDKFLLMSSNSTITTQ